MRVKVLASGAACDVVAVMEGDSCPAEDFLAKGDLSTESYREGLYEMLVHVSRMGIEMVPQAWKHEANKQEAIYEFIKGPLRLFFFKGAGRQVAVCTSGVRKKGNKTDKGAVAKAAALRVGYEKAVQSQTLEVFIDEEN